MLVLHITPTNTAETTWTFFAIRYFLIFILNIDKAGKFLISFETIFHS